VGGLSPRNCSLERYTGVLLLPTFWGFLPYKMLGNFPSNPSACPTTPSVLPLSVTVRHGRATCQNHVVYQGFATVSLLGLGLAFISLPWDASFLSMFNSHRRRLHRARGTRAPTFRNGWARGAPWVEKQQTKLY